MFTGKSAVLLLCNAFVVSFCGSQLAYGDTAPCDLLTQAQVSAVIGASAGAGSPIANTGCSWQSTEPHVVVSVSMQNEKMFAGVKRGTPPNMTKTTVSGVGDEAVFVGTERFASLWVRKGSKYLLVRIYGVPLSEAQAKLKALATSAVSKL